LAFEFNVLELPPVTSMDRLLPVFGVQRDRDEMPPEFVFPLGTAPCIRLDRGSERANALDHVVADAIFSFVPEFASRLEWAKKT
jgi:hypothetical protein